MVTRSIVQSAIHTAATALVHLPQEEWAGWIAYLCQMLEETAKAQNITYNPDIVLEQVREVLQERLAHGSW
ncbi:MAG: hypothetical protein JXA33_16220 [Anaerolineae bacterium]|nr:hypothetical protein [Anaerolineae bacterium]